VTAFAQDKEGLRQGIVDLGDVLGIDPTKDRHAHLEALDASALEALRALLKQDKRWPEPV
jgi:hypothetical protein